MPPQKGQRQRIIINSEVMIGEKEVALLYSSSLKGPAAKFTDSCLMRCQL